MWKWLRGRSFSLDRTELLEAVNYGFVNPKILMSEFLAPLPILILTTSAIQNEMLYL